MHYPLRRKEREIQDNQTICRLLQSGKYMVLALARNQEPYAVTLSYGYDEPNHVCYFHCANTGLKLDFLAENPLVCATLVVDLGYVSGQCSHKYQSLVIRGRMEKLEDLADKKHALQVLLQQLEENPGPIIDRNLASDAAYNSVTVLRLSLDHITGKQGS
jgi:Predicted flavin-nucleotide-binding protein